MTTSKFLRQVAWSLQSQMLICCILYCQLPHTEEQLQKSKQGLPAHVLKLLKTHVSQPTSQQLISNRELKVDRCEPSMLHT